MEVRFVIVAPPRSRKAYTVRLPLVVGRAEDAKFRIPQDSVSRRHCEFACDADGVTVTDLGSTNGTAVGGRRLEPHATVAVPSGAEVLIGGVLLRVEYVAEAVAAAAVASRDDDTVPLPAASATAAEAPELELEPALESLPELEAVEDAAGAPTPAVAVLADPPALPDVEPPATGDTAFPDATPAVADGSFDFLAAEPAPPAADDKLDDFFKSLS